MTKLERLRQTRAVYARMFLGADGKPHNDGLDVLLELRRFCGVDKRYSSDTNTAFHQLGMREVYQHIVQLLKLDQLALASEHQQEIAAHERPANAEQ